MHFKGEKTIGKTNIEKVTFGYKTNKNSHLNIIINFCFISTRQTIKTVVQSLEKNLW